MKISTWNVNSVRARIDNIKDYLKKNNPDILLMQEIKTEEKNYPFDDFKKLKYESYVFGQKSYNGVAIISLIMWRLIFLKIRWVTQELSQQM